MSTTLDPPGDFKVLADPAELPSNIPQVPELGATSAPLLSASYFIGARCKPFGDDYMLCKSQSNGNGEIDCLKEGRKITRCAISVIQDINKSCLDDFRLHWQCLERNNHQLHHCRQAETLLNNCVYKNLNLEKHIPDAAYQVHLKKNPVLRPNRPDAESVSALRKAQSDGIV